MVLWRIGRVCQISNQTVRALGGMVDTGDLKSPSFGSVGSSPTARTTPESLNRIFLPGPDACWRRDRPRVRRSFYGYRPIYQKPLWIQRIVSGLPQLGRVWFSLKQNCPDVTQKPRLIRIFRFQEAGSMRIPHYYYIVNRGTQRGGTPYVVCRST